MAPKRRKPPTLSLRLHLVQDTEAIALFLYERGGITTLSAEKASNSFYAVFFPNVEAWHGKPIKKKMSDANQVNSSMAHLLHNGFRLFTGIVAACLLYDCSPVEVVRLSSEHFPPRQVSEVEILDKEPTTDHLRLAELVASSSTSSLDDLQQDILKKAAKLGASAVIFSRPTTHTEQRIAQGAGYSPWGYYAPFYYGPGPRGYFGYGYGGWPYATLGYGSLYGPWGPGWGYTSMPYTVQVRTLKGLAIRYSGS